MAKRLIGHDRSKIGTANADVDDIPDAFAGIPRPLAGAHAIGKSRHPTQHRVDFGDHIFAVDHDRRILRRTQSHVEHGATFGDVDFLTAEHGLRPGAEAAFLRQLEEQRQRFIRNQILRVVEEQTRPFGGELFATLGVIRE